MELVVREMLVLVIFTIGVVAPELDSELSQLNTVPKVNERNDMKENQLKKAVVNGRLTLW